MDKRRMGSLEVSVVGLGCNNFGWRLDANETANVVHAALDAGVNFLDTADIYGGTKSEEYLGRALRGRREQVVLATKFGMKVDEQRHGAKPDYVRRAAEDSLRRLATEYIDLYQLHQPDPETPIAETLAVLDELVKSGKVREIGCSNFSARQIREAQAAVEAGGARFISVQNEYSLLHREPEKEVLPECARSGLSFLPYFPLANGLLTGKYRAGRPAPQGTRISTQERFGKLLTERNLEIVEGLIRFAESRGHSMLELAFGWLLAQPVVASVIAGATSAQQIRSNAAASCWRLTTAELAEVERILEHPAISRAS